jgi:hypothetical protein
MALVATYFIVIPVAVGLITYLTIKPKPEQAEMSAIKTRVE